MLRQQRRSALRKLQPRECRFAELLAPGVWRPAAQRAFGDCDLLGGKHHPRHKHARQADSFRRDSAYLDNFINFNDGAPRALGEARMKMHAAAAKLDVATRIRAETSH